MRIETNSQMAVAPRPQPVRPAPVPAQPPAEPRPAPSGTALGEAAHEAFVEAALNLKSALGPVHHTDLNIAVDVRSSTMQIRVVDQRTGETVREIPPEALRKFAEAFDVYLGTLLDTAA